MDDIRQVGVEREAHVSGWLAILHRDGRLLTRTDEDALASSVVMGRWTTIRLKKTRTRRGENADSDCGILPALLLFHPTIANPDYFPAVFTADSLHYGACLLAPIGRSRQKGPPPGETGQEALYLRFLSEKQVPVTVKLRDGEAVYGWIEYFDDRMIRLTREGKPNLFIYKQQIRTISESFRHIDARRRERIRSSARSETVSAPAASESGLAVAFLPPPNAASNHASGIDALVEGNSHKGTLDS